MTRHNWDEDTLNKELKNRQRLLEYMVEKEMDECDVISLIRGYYVNPEKTMKMVEKDTGKKYKVLIKNQLNAVQSQEG